MAKKILLISPDVIKGLTNIDDNTQEKFLTPAICETQDMDFTQVVGTAMVEKLQELVSGNTIGSEGNEMYKALLEKAKYFMVYATISRLPMISSFHLSNMGVNQGNDDNNAVVSFSDVVSVEDYYIKKADFYKKTLQDWCCANINDLPELKSCKKGDTKANLNSAASTGIWLGGARGKSIKPKCSCGK